MDIMKETPEEANMRLLRVLKATDVVWREETYAFKEFPDGRLSPGSVTDSLACVRDGGAWSVLAPAGPGDQRLFAVVTLHFPPGADNSGFVGWLATILKRELDTGVIVICGYNSGRGGIFDYYGVPIGLREATAKLLLDLRRRG